jgi:hypothetical protein
MNDERNYLRKKNSLLMLLKKGMPSILISEYLNISAATTVNWVKKIRKSGEWNGELPSFSEGISNMLMLLSKLELKQCRVLSNNNEKLYDFLNVFFETERIVEALDLYLLSPYISNLLSLSFESDVPLEYQNFVNKLVQWNKPTMQTGRDLWEEYLKNVNSRKIILKTKKQENIQKIILEEITYVSTNSLRKKIPPVITSDVCEKIEWVLFQVLKPREADILKKYFLAEGKNNTLESIAKKYKLSSQRIMVIKDCAMKKIMNSSVFLIIFEHNPSNEMITYLNKKVIMNVKKGKETKAIISTKHPIREANLSTGNINVLLGQGIAYLEDVSAYSEIKLLDLRGFGKKKLYELKEIMNKHDLPFKE